MAEKLEKVLQDWGAAEREKKLRERMAEQEDEINSLKATVEHLLYDERPKLEADRNQLREALEKYGRHTLMCFSHTASSACTCGFRQALNNPNPPEADNG